MDQHILQDCKLDPNTALLKYPVAFRVESKGRPPSVSAPIYNGPTLRSIIWGPATLEFATKHLLEDESATPFVSVLWIWDRALQRAETLANQGCFDIRIFIIDLAPLHADFRVYDAYKLSKSLGFKSVKTPGRPCTDDHKGELLLHCGNSEQYCSVLASIPAGMPTIYYDSTLSSSGILRLPVEYFEQLSQRLVTRSRGGVRKSMLMGIIEDVKTTDEETWLDEGSAKLLQDVLEDELLDQCQALGRDKMEKIPSAIIKAMTMDVSDYLGLMKVIKLPDTYFVPEKKLGREYRQSFMSF
ncbi:uncharacterized protein RCC_12285 [Ramularia collo-cygni]|uniref:Uncharacterized protein n=1 Tax=Ramularia collo-cygni TaxID=112498 RepID=A0A2D3UVM7_9PEZI|nr:uncharacterized protein RCC_12285 [Ramularia collo-cygni]CZT15066.1 uncharacterized protein RCC_12285 [Ramularia collo-cygni]